MTPHARALRIPHPSVRTSEPQGIGGGTIGAINAAQRSAGADPRTAEGRRDDPETERTGTDGVHEHFDLCSRQSQNATFGRGSCWTCTAASRSDEGLYLRIFMQDLQSWLLGCQQKSRGSAHGGLPPRPTPKPPKKHHHKRPSRNPWMRSRIGWPSMPPTGWGRAVQWADTWIQEL